MVGELTTKPEWEPKAYAVVPFIWAIGTIIGPAIGGILVNPAASYPDHFSKDGLFGRFPYLLPNLVCASFMVVSIVSAYLWLRETHPDLQRGQQGRRELIRKARHQASTLWGVDVTVSSGAAGGTT